MTPTEILESRLARMEAINDIRGVMADYCHYYDVGWAGAGRDPDRMAALFLEDGVWDVDTMTPIVGRQRIRDFCADIAGTNQMSCHIAINPRIDVDGDGAKGAWAAFCPLVTADGQAMWLAGRYECDFRRTEAGWRIAVMRWFTAFHTPYELGFGKVRIAMPDAFLAGAEGLSA